MEKQKQEIWEIDLKLLQGALKKELLSILGTGLLCLLISAGIAVSIPPQYQSCAMFCVQNHPAENADGLTSADISAARELVRSCIVILNSRQTLTDIIRQEALAMDWETLEEKIDAQAVDATELFTVTVTGTDARETEILAGAIAEILPRRVGEVLEGAGLKVVDSADVPARRVERNLLLWMMTAFLSGSFLKLLHSVGKEVCRQQKRERA